MEIPAFNFLIAGDYDTDPQMTRYMQQMESLFQAAEKKGILNIAEWRIVTKKKDITETLKHEQFDVLLCFTPIAYDKIGSGTMKVWQGIQKQLKIMLFMERSVRDGDAETLPSKKPELLYKNGFYDCYFIGDMRGSDVINSILTGRTAEEAYSYYKLDMDSEDRMDKKVEKSDSYASKSDTKSSNAATCDNIEGVVTEKDNAEDRTGDSVDKMTDPVQEEGQGNHNGKTKLENGKVQQSKKEQSGKSVQKEVSIKNTADVNIHNAKSITVKGSATDLRQMHEKKDTSKTEKKHLKNNDLDKEKRKERYRQIMPHNNHLTVSELDELGFFTAPASVSEHGSYEGGLFDHSFAMTQSLLDLTEKLGLKWERAESPYIIGMYHDICRCDQYIYDTRTDSYRYEERSILPGHGEKSLLVLMQYLQLTQEEIACIRWHMGAYEQDIPMWRFYDQAVRQYPNVLYTHMADMITKKIKNI